MKLTNSIYRKALELKQPLFPWLPLPSENVIRCHEYWETEQRDAYYMVMEYANLGELLNVIDHLHRSIYRDKLSILDQLQGFEDSNQRTANIEAYKAAIKLESDGSSCYIELIRYIFQQMV